ncbi:MAG: lamin tail domain-containing protein [Akkermansiaceae bacterium]|nr:lamin tail domain-containing protein [Akkermansiaceae bacterium]
MNRVNVLIPLRDTVMKAGKYLPAAAALAAVVLFGVASPGGAQTIFTEDFDGFTAPAGNFNGGQYQSGLAVAFSGALPGWGKAGGGTVHAVDTANVHLNGIVNPQDFAVMIWQDNVITQSAAIPGSNDAGVTYEVSFDASPAVYQVGSQQTSAADGLRIEVLDPASKVLATHTHNPGAWAGDVVFVGDSFQYTGDGSGDVRLRIGPSAFNSGRFGGAIDHLEVLVATPIFKGYATNPAVHVAGHEIVPNFPLLTGGAASGFGIAPPLPGGLVIDPVTGTITGTPGAASPPTEYTITASFPAGANQTASLDLSVLASSTLEGYSTSPATYIAGVPSAPNTPAVHGATPESFAVSPALPSGLVLDPLTGIITGTPSSATAATDHTVTATFSGEPDSAFDLNIEVVEFSTTVVISELMASNNTTLNDGDGNSSDWIEIHNFGPVPVNLGGWHLTDRADNLNKWQFPAVVVPAGGYLVVFASNQEVGDYIDAGGFIHTNFSLSAGGEFLGLVEPDGMTVAHSFAPYFPPQTTDISYGLASDLTMIGFFTAPTPGSPNPASPSTLGPFISHVTDPPQPVPGDNDDLVISAQVDALANPVSSATLHYRVMFGAEQAVPMNNSGTGLFSATIPHTASGPGDMVRWYVTAEDSAGVSRREPPFLDPTNSPEYFGTIIADPAAASALPTLFWFVASPGAADTRSGTRSSVCFAGQFYDNVFTRVRGATSEGVAKKSYKFEFNTGHRFLFSPDVPRVSEINVNTTYQDKAYIRPQLTYDSYTAAGAVASDSSTWRIEQNGAFFSVASFVEQVDADLLGKRGLDPEGALYKMFNGVTSATSDVEKETRHNEDNSDLQALVDGVNPLNPNRAEFLFDHIDIPAMINYATAGIISQDFDRWAKNFHVYRDTNGSGEWLQIPHDKDLTFGNRFYDDEISGDGFSVEAGLPPERRRAHPFQGAAQNACCGAPNLMIDILVTDPRTREMYLRRLRTLMDEQLQPPGTPSGALKFEARIDELATAIAPDAALDLAKWGALYGIVRDFPTAIALLKTNYLDERRVYLYQTHAVGGSAGSVGIPDAQPGGLQLAIGAVEFNPASGDQNEEYIEITNPNRFAVDVSGWTVEGTIEHTFTPGTVIPSSATGLPLHLSPDVNAFRARATAPTGNAQNFVQGNYRGQLSARGETITIRDQDGNVAASTTYAGAPGDLQQFLRITELHYHPANPSAAEIAAGFDNDGFFEFIELMNTGPATLDLGGARFVAGVDFVFPANTFLASGAHILVVADAAAFALRYGSDPPARIAGQYTGRLSNDGELLQLHDAVGENILKFTYHDRWFPATDGSGYALVILDHSAPWDHWDLATSWGIGSPLGGTPGDPNGPDVLQQFAGWLNSHFSASEIADPLLAAPDADPDLDGRGNFAEYAFGTNPRLLDAPAGLTMQRVGEFLELTSRYRSPALDLAIDCESSDDGTTWVPFIPERVASSGDGTFATVTWRLPLPSPTAPAPPTLLVRVRATMVPVQP